MKFFVNLRYKVKKNRLKQPKITSKVQTKTFKTYCLNAVGFEGENHSLSEFIF
jgi:hypothetical protein